MTIPSAVRAPHGLAIQLIPQYFKVEPELERMVFTAEGHLYYRHWYSLHGLAFNPEGLTFSRFKIELLGMVASEIDAASASIASALQTGEIRGLEARVAGFLLRAELEKAAVVAGLAAQARAGVVVQLPR